MNPDYIDTVRLLLRIAPAVAQQKPAPKRGFRFHVLRAMDQPRSCSSAALKVALGRMALLALATSGR